MKKSSVLFIVLSLLLGLSACMHEQRFPTDGIWHCEELQAHFTIGHGDGSDYEWPDGEFIVDETENYVIVNGDRIACLWGVLHDSTRVEIFCQELDHPDYDAGENIYAFDFVSLSDTEYVLKDDAGKHYTFERIGDTPTDD